MNKPETCNNGIKQNGQIPKIIHQIHMGDANFSDREIFWQKTWKLYNPDWEYIFWDDSKLKKLKPINQKYIDQSSKYSMKSDLLRYEVLYRYGGIYVDTDFECLKNMNDFISNQDFLICKQTPPNLHSGVKICGAFMAAAKHHIVIKKLIDGVEPRSKSHKNKGCVWKYGPGYLNDLVPKSLWLDSGHVYPYMWHEKENQPTDHNELKKTFPDSYAVHHWNGSWI